MTASSDWRSFEVRLNSRSCNSDIFFSYSFSSLKLTCFVNDIVAFSFLFFLSIRTSAISGKARARSFDVVSKRLIIYRDNIDRFEILFAIDRAWFLRRTDKSDDVLADAVKQLLILLLKLVDLTTYYKSYLFDIIICCGMLLIFDKKNKLLRDADSEILYLT